MNNYDSEPSGSLTCVELPPDGPAQLAFLRQLQAVLKSVSSQSSLPLLDLQAHTYVIAQALEDTLRRVTNSQSDEQWRAQLIRWGAREVHIYGTEGFWSRLRRDLGAFVRQLGQSGKLSNVESSPNATGAAVSRFPVVPGKLAIPRDWHMHDQHGANIVNAWKLFAKSKTLPWRDIPVGHIDTGYTRHRALGWDGEASSHVFPALGHDFWQDRATSRDDFTNLARYDSPGDWDDPYDREQGPFGGHGTRISAAIAGYLEGNQPFAGVAPGAPIISFRVTDSVIVDHVKADIARAIRRAVSAGCKVINISLGAATKDRELADALDHAYESGVIVCCAAGQIWRSVIYPGRYGRCLTLAGTGPSSLPWASSALGKRVDLCAPADEIRRVKAVKGDPPSLGDAIHTRADGDGTSYATAMCSGTAVLWLAYHSAALSNTYSEPWQVPEAFYRLARQSARPHPNSTPPGYGAGILDAHKLITMKLPVLAAGDKSPKAD